MKKYKAAIIGCGRIASLFAMDKKRKGVVTHAQAYQQNPKTELIAASDLDTARLKDFGQEWKVKNLYQDAAEMLRTEKPDIVSICTPTTTHRQIVELPMKSGVKAVFCEKPMTLTVNDAKLLHKSLKKNVVFAVNHTRRWDLFEQRIKKYIQDGKLGKIQVVDAYYTAGISNTGSHLIDLICMLSGAKITSVQALPKENLSSDPTVDCIMKTEQGFNVFLHGLEVKDYLSFEIDIYGALGRIRVTQSGFDCEFWQAKPHRVFSSYKELIKMKNPFGKGYQKVLENAVQNLIDSIEGRDKIYSGYKEGLEVVQVIAAVNRSLKLNGKTIGI